MPQAVATTPAATPKNSAPAPQTMTSTMPAAARTQPSTVATVLGYCLGVYLAVQGVSTLYDALRLHKAQHECGREILLGIIMLSGGILLLCFPLTSSRVVMMVLGVALAVIGVLQLVLRIRERQFPELHTGRPDIIDADE